MVCSDCSLVVICVQNGLQTSLITQVMERFAGDVVGYEITCSCCLISLSVNMCIRLQGGFVPAEWMTGDNKDPFLFALLFSISVVVVSCPCALGQ